MEFMSVRAALLLGSILSLFCSNVAAQALCESAASDVNGDGFGWENNASCRVTVKPQRPVCLSAASDSNGDGFGWESGATCIVATDSTPTPPASTQSSAVRAATPFCESSDSDTNGDGYGWESGASCRVDNASTGVQTSSLRARTPVCQLSNSDSNGDGFGWESGASCRVVSDSTEARPAAMQSSALRAATPVCQSPDSDSNGDGFGWESGASCRVDTSATEAPPVQAAVVPSTRPDCQSSDSDSNGDGFGWENGRTCLVSSSVATLTQGSLPLAEEKVVLRLPACSDARFDLDNDGFGWENSLSCTSRNAGNGGRSITDVVLVTGQSNALGAETSSLDPLSYIPSQDSPVERVYAYSENGWGIAGLQQIWDLGWYPRSDIAGQPANNFAFHFGKSLVRYEPDAVVGIVMVTAPGKAIDHWETDGDFFSQIDTKVRRALNALPGDVKVSGVLWHQGESDFYNTSYYEERLKQLIGDFRGREWFANDGVFVCGETLNSPVNETLRALNRDGDSRTGCASSAQLESVGDDVHFNAASLRLLGGRYATKYRSMSR